MARFNVPSSVWRLLALAALAYVGARGRRRPVRFGADPFDRAPGGSPPRTGRLAALAISLVGVLAAGAFGAWFWWYDREEKVAIAITGGDPSRAPPLLRRYGCAGCHTIAGLPGADGKVAAPLDHLRQRVYIAGSIANSPDNLVRWIASPQAISPGSAMPDTGISEDEARNVAAFLYAQ
jgi:cytochrome c